MSRQLQFFVLAALAVTLPAAARQLTPAAAIARAMEEPGLMKLSPADRSADGYVRVQTVALDGEPQVYVFNRTADAGGYVVVPASDLAVPVLGYADSGVFDASAVPPAMQAWLDFYAAEVAAAEASEPSGALGITRPKRAAIAPMLTTKWNQDAPYNNDCPKIGGRQTYTGCVATALAQVLNYKEWPERGTGSHSYQSGSTTITLDFSEIEFDWDNMLDSYSSSATTAQKEAVAELMYAVGVASDMEYGTYASGAISQDAAAGLVRNLGYDPGLQYLMRDNYGIVDWENLVYDQLVAYGPVYYDGVTGDSEGHAFVCDGYSSDGYFHFNWGWGGMSDGYFLLTALDPSSQGIGGASSGFNFLQGIFADLKPAEANSATAYAMTLSGQFTTSTTAIMTGSSVTFSAGAGSTGMTFNMFYNSSYATIPSVTYGVQITSASGDVTYASGPTASNVKPLMGAKSYQVTLPQTLASGTYAVRPAYKADGREWQAMAAPAGTDGYLVMAVDGASVTISSPQGNLAIGNLALASEVYAGYRFKLTANAVNRGDDEFYGQAKAVLLNASGTKIVASSQTVMLDIPAGDSEDLSFISYFPASTAAGEYNLGIADGSNNLLSETIPVTVKTVSSASTSVSATISVLDSSSVNPLDMRVDASVSCSSGYFADGVVFMIFNSTGSIQRGALAYDDMLFIGEGDSSDITIRGQFPDGVKGTRYLGCLFSASYGEQLSSAVRFTVGDAIDGIVDIEVEAAGSAVRFYDLQGREVTIPKPGSVYIVVTESGASKVIF